LLLVCSAGYNINMRDCANGKTALIAVALMRTLDDCSAAELEDEVDHPDGATPSCTQAHLAELTRQLLARGADPAVLDNNGNSALHHAAKRGAPALISLYLQWAAQRQGDSSLSTLSDFVNHRNIFGNTPLHYAFYTAHQGQHHVHALQLLLSAGLSPSQPVNAAMQTPLELFAAPEIGFSREVCHKMLRMSVGKVMEQVQTKKKVIKRRGQNRMQRQASGENSLGFERAHSAFFYLFSPANSSVLRHFRWQRALPDRGGDGGEIISDRRSDGAGSTLCSSTSLA